LTQWGAAQRQPHHRAHAAYLEQRLREIDEVARGDQPLQVAARVEPLRLRRDRVEREDAAHLQAERQQRHEHHHRESRSQADHQGVHTLLQRRAQHGIGRGAALRGHLGDPSRPSVEQRAQVRQV
jgi:ABC-type Zn2+ transport system substrate-binding protein/surface adhesin